MTIRMTRQGRSTAEGMTRQGRSTAEGMTRQGRSTAEGMTRQGRSTDRRRAMVSVVIVVFCAYFLPPSRPSPPFPSSTPPATPLGESVHLLTIRQDRSTPVGMIKRLLEASVFVPTKDCRSGFYCLYLSVSRRWRAFIVEEGGWVGVHVGETSSSNGHWWTFSPSDPGRCYLGTFGSSVAPEPRGCQEMWKWLDQLELYVW